MTLYLPTGLPCIDALRADGFPIETFDPGSDRGADALQVGILNLMPDKQGTEAQLARMLAGSRHDIRLILFATNAYMAQARKPDYRSSNTPPEHLRRFYASFDEVRAAPLDGLIITGAPLEQLPFQDVPYWPEMLEILDWVRDRQLGSFSICWGAQAALQHFHGVPKHVLDKKCFGVYEQRVLDRGEVLDGFGAAFRVPVSRFSETRREDLPPGLPLRVLAESDEAGICLIEDPVLGAVYMLNHFEYDEGTLRREYERDISTGKTIGLPENYFPGNDPQNPPEAVWADDGQRFYGNWVESLARRKAARNTEAGA